MHQNFSQTSKDLSYKQKCQRKSGRNMKYIQELLKLKSKIHNKRLMHSQMSSIIFPVPNIQGTNALLNTFKSERTQHNFRRLGQNITILNYMDHISYHKLLVKNTIYRLT